MDIIKSGSNSVRSNSKPLKTILVCFIIFMMLPIDSMLRIRVQSQVASPLRQLLDNDVMKIILTFIFYLIVQSNDVLLLVLYMCALKKLGL